MSAAPDTDILPVVPADSRILAKKMAHIMAATDRNLKDRPALRAPVRMNEQVQEMLTSGSPETRAFRVVAAVEVIRSRVMDAYGLDDE